ncbi:Hypothetical_protein [Hexamita inflata]|uniref:Hypothetical_protein n=1 Tax=Hexamita inflata TaxID=28002 RepID=A0AA86UVA9_9EUKA|nr:Hypothetical protein HINF_LOCUS53882 [Hexamita inflata]
MRRAWERPTNSAKAELSRNSSSKKDQLALKDAQTESRRLARGREETVAGRAATAQNNSSRRSKAEARGQTARIEGSGPKYPSVGSKSPEERDSEAGRGHENRLGKTRRPKQSRRTETKNSRNRGLKATPP